VLNFADSINSSEKSKILKFPYLILAVSILLTVGVTYNFYQSSRTKDLIRFSNEVGRVQSSIDNKINVYVVLLNGARGFIESSEELNRKSFANYVDSLNLEQNYAGVLGIGYSKVILPNEHEALIKKMKSEGYSDFKIFPEGERNSYQAVIYFEPLNESNKKALGFDMSTEKNMRQALELAKDFAIPAATGKIVLNKESEPDIQSGFLIYLPIYKNKEIPITTEERRQNLIGYIYSPFRVKDFLDEIQKNTAASGISARIYDAEIKPENLMSQTNYVSNKNFVSEIDNPYLMSKELNIAERKWVIEYKSLPEFADQSSIGWTPLIFLSGIIFSFLLFGMTYWEAFARAKLQATALKLLESEKQKQGLLENEQKARLVAEQANSTKDEFIAVISHELRTPLNAIAGWTRILRTENLSDKTKILALEKIDRNLRSQTKLVEELLDYSQILSGTIYFEGKQVDFNEVFENTFQEIELKAKEKSIELLKDNQLNGHTILGDEDKLKIVIYNLLSNAVKFTQLGGKVETQLFENDGTVQMTVKDNGRGISPDFLPHIFDRFSQADTSTTRGYGGLGLGLTVSNHIVKLYNGTIEANSEGLGKGSVFTLKFPYQKD
jgi:signal transduction histidine kinase